MKKLALIYGIHAAVMKAAAAEFRAVNKEMDVNLRSADHFTLDQIEPAAAVYIMGNYPKIAEAYEGKAEVIVVQDDLEIVDGKIRAASDKDDKKSENVEVIDKKTPELDVSPAVKSPKKAAGVGGKKKSTAKA